MWAKITKIKRTKDINYFSLCSLNLFYLLNICIIVILNIIACMNIKKPACHLLNNEPMLNKNVKFFKKILIQVDTMF